MNRIIMSLMLIVLAASAAGGATWSYFNSQKVLGASTVSTGNLILDLKAGGERTSFLNVDNLLPGQTTPEFKVDITNTGSTNFGWVGKFLFGGNEDLQKQVFIQDMKMEFLSPNNNSWEQTDQFITDGTGSGPYPAYYNDLANTDPLKKISLNTWKTKYSAMIPPYPYFEGALKPEYKYRLSFKLAFDKSGTIQNGAFSLGFQANATQLDQEALNTMMTSLGTPATPDLSWMNAQIAKQTIN